MTAHAHPRAGTGGLALVRLGAADLPEIVRFHARLHAEAPRPGLFVRETDAFFARHLGEAGRIFGLVDGARRLVAYSVLGLPAPDAPENFGHDIGLPAAELGRVAHLDGSGVQGDFRGLGLQRTLTQHRLADARAEGRDIALAAVAPANRWSLASLLTAGLAVVAHVEKYGAERFMLRRDLGASATTEGGALPAGPVIPIEGAAAAHRAALAAGLEGRALVIGAGGAPALAYAAPARRRPERGA